MRQNTLSVIQSQTRAQTPPDHAGVQYDDGDECTRVSSCWAVFYDGERNESRGSCVLTWEVDNACINLDVYGWRIDMANHQVSSLLNQLKSIETYTRNDAIKIIIKENINDEQIIAALKDVIENDPSMSARNFARSALDTFGVEHSRMEEPAAIKNTVVVQSNINDAKNSKIVNTILFIVVGIILVVIGLPLLFWLLLSIGIH